MGSFATNLAFVAAVVASIAAAAAVARPRHRLSALRVSRIAFITSTSLTGLAIMILGRALWTVDPAWLYVARHSSDQTPLAYRIAGIWGGMEGSLLFWSFVVASTFMAAVVLGRTRPVDQQLVLLGVGGVTTATFLFVSRMWASPFTRLDIPTGDGDGLLAVLQHPAMVYHPPILYLGLAMTGVPFALTLLALVQRRLDDAWKASVLPWLRLGWVVLGVGIVTGSQWAYAELGWGGFWAWDPVENSSLLPWLAFTIAIHMLIEPGGRLAFSGAAAIVGAFGLMVSGVYVTRSGNTGSIHAFSESPQVGRPLLALASVAVLVGIAALVLHRDAIGQSSRPGLKASTVLGTQGILGAVAIVAIALGTFWPVFDGLLLSNVGTRALVRPAYYHQALAPVAALALLAMAVGPLLASGKTHAPTGRRLATVASAGAGLALAGAVLAVGSTGWLTAGSVAVIGSAGVAVAGSILHGTRKRSSGRRRSTGVAIAHCGFALLLLGAVASSGGSDDTIRINVGQSTDVDRLSSPAVSELGLVALTPGRTDRYEYIRATIELEQGNSRAQYVPELRAYEDQRIPTTEAVIDGSLRSDTIVVLESVDDDLGSATFTVRTRPLLPWVWLGALLVVGGGLVTLSDQRRVSTGELDAVADRSVATTQQ